MDFGIRFDDIFDVFEEITESDKFEIGQHLIGYPQHICPTVALHSKANLIINNNITSKSWEVTSRNRV